ncbi:hypothetical protein H5410_013363 [Solanum commersonii]|uniref:Uncharacterized protein n=1 Tax=Solanum commersonii TaxID=4109 RepID=A0A9J6AUX8_SOLCO|nr:hypothetical protein H5410_013363 [Solanum commersonii]
MSSEVPSLYLEQEAGNSSNSHLVSSSLNGSGTYAQFKCRRQNIPDDCIKSRHDIQEVLTWKIKIKVTNIERMLKTPIKKLKNVELQQLSEIVKAKLNEVEDVAKQQMERGVAFPYQILGNALAPSKDE